MKQLSILFLGLFGWLAIADTDYSRVANMSDEEAIQFFVKNGGGVKRDKNWRRDSKAKWIRVPIQESLPAKFDLRELHPGAKLQPIKRQQCGDCWAHSVLAVLESQWALTHLEDAFNIYAQQELISTCGNTGGGCNGGYFEAFDYVTGRTGKGLPMERDLPYQGHTTSCNKTVPKSPRAVDWSYVGERYDYDGPSIEEMKQALMDYGSLSVTVYAFSHTGSSVFTSCPYGTINHMVNIEGWVDDANVQSGGYWIMRNSWGTSFGENGYAKVAYKDRYGRKCSNLGETVAVVTKM